MRTVSERSGRVLSLMALLVVGLFLGTCVTALAEAGPSPAGACGPGTAEEIGMAKAPHPGLLALAGPTIVLSVGLFTFTPLLLPLPAEIRLDFLWRNSASRAPPAS